MKKHPTPRRSNRFALLPDPRLAALEARQLLTTLVAIVDTGVDLTDPTDSPYYDLADGYDAYRQQTVASSGSSVVQDNGHTPDGATGHWHGSTIADDVVAGIIAAKSQAGAGNADVKILPIRATADNGYYDVASVIRGIHYAADHGAAAIDLSFRASTDFSSPSTGETLSQAIAYAASKGSVVSVAAANDHVNIDDPSNPVTLYPASIRGANMIVSAATDSSGALSTISNWGPKTVDLGSPAIQGATSYAAGYTAGVIGVVAALDPSLSAVDRINLVKQTVTITPQSVGAWSTTGGVINPQAAAAKAIQLANPGGGSTTSPPSSSAPAAGTVAIAAGSSALPTGYLGDAKFVTGGSTYSTSHAIDTSGVSNPLPTSVYQSERWTGTSMTYVVPGFTAGGACSVRLDFSENYFTSAGQRNFNVLINGTPVLANFDIYATAGGQYKAVSKTFTASADAAGQVSITLVNVKGGAKVDGIQVAALAGSPTGTGTGTTTSGTATPVDLSGSYNTVGFSTDANARLGNIDGWGYSYSATAIGSTVSALGVTFALPAADAYDAVKAAGQSIALPGGKFSSIKLLGTAVNGAQAATFTVNYADGTSATVRQTLSDWHTASGASGETVAATSAYRNASSGRDNVYGFNLYAYSIGLDPTKVVKSLTLPNNANVVVVVASLVA